MTKKGGRTHFLQFTSLITRFYKQKYVALPNPRHIIPLLEPIGINTLNTLYAKAIDARRDSDPFGTPLAYISAFHSVNMQTLAVELSQQMATGFSLVYDRFDIISSKINHM